MRKGFLIALVNSLHKKSRSRLSLEAGPIVNLFIVTISPFQTPITVDASIHILSLNTLKISRVE